MWAFYRYAVCLIAAVELTACSRHRAGNAPDAKWEFSAEAVAGQLRVYAEETISKNRTLIRSKPWTKNQSAGPDARTLKQQEIKALTLWRECESRILNVWPNAYAEHDALLETARRLETRLEQDPEHLGVLRDLISTYATLLGFESHTQLGSNLFMLTARRVSEFETKAAPLDRSDSALIENLRACLFNTMQLYPCVVDLLTNSTALQEKTKLQQALELQGQNEFVKLDNFRIGSATVQAYRTLGVPPDPKLLWAELYFIISNHDPMTPESTTAYVLVRTGKVGEERYYLYFRSLNRSQLNILYGRTRPSYGSVRQLVQSSVESALGPLATK